MITIHVCIGTACHVKGGYHVINTLQTMVRERKLADKVKVEGAFCLGECMKAVAVRIDDGPVYSVDENSLGDFFEQFVLSRLVG
jgi:NADH:ubiquinone oxidoreductase subunit E